MDAETRNKIMDVLKRHLPEEQSLQAMSELEAVLSADGQADADKDEGLEFGLFWEAYDKKVERAKSQALWNRLSKRDRKAAMEYIPAYKQAQPDKRFRKNPATFLRNRGWEDELIQSQPVSRVPDTVMRHYDGGFDNMEKFGD